MKGLLLKDLALLKNQSNYILVVVAISLFMLFSGNDSVFIISYSVMLFAMFGISTLSYDYFNNGYAFLFTLPITRKLYVLEKYVFSLLCVLAGSVIALALMYVGSLIRESVSFSSDDVSFVVGYVFGAMIFLTFVLPIQMKFGPEKGRIGMLVFFMLILAMGTGIKNVMGTEKVVELFAKLSTKLSFMAPTILLGLLGIFAMILLAISYLVSCKIMMNKEF